MRLYGTHSGNMFCALLGIVLNCGRSAASMPDVLVDAEADWDTVSLPSHLSHAPTPELAEPIIQHVGVAESVIRRRTGLLEERPRRRASQRLFTLGPDSARGE